MDDSLGPCGIVQLVELYFQPACWINFLVYFLIYFLIYFLFYFQLYFFLLRSFDFVKIFLVSYYGSALASVEYTVKARATDYLTTACSGVL
jgi:hypothetical protein